MSKKTKEESVILSATEHWERQLGTKLREEEFYRYRKLNDSLPEKDLEKLGGVYFITQHEWKDYINNELLEKLDIKKLQEFSYYLRGKARWASQTEEIFKTILVPLEVAIIVPVLIEKFFDKYFEKILKDVTLIDVFGMVFILLLILGVVGFFGARMVKGIQEETLKRHFYEDLKEIVDEKIETRKRYKNRGDVVEENNGYYVYYDAHLDNLTIKDSNHSGSIYSDEIFNNIYLYRDDESNEVVGTQIMYFRQRSLTVLEKYLPDVLLKAVLDIKQKI